MSDPDWLQELKQKDPRVNRVERMVRIEEELRDSVIVKLLCDYAESEARDAREQLVRVSPSAPAEIARLQQMATLPELIKDVIEGALLSGRAAVNELNEESDAA